MDTFGQKANDLNAMVLAKLETAMEHALSATPIIP